MRILLHDYSGHPCQVQLSRSLAGRGHSVRHVYSSSFQTPRGALLRRDEDPPGFEISPVELGAPFDKTSFVRRRAQEIAVGRLVARQVADFRPDVVLSSNAPLDTQHRILAASRRTGARFVFWLQDLYSEAIRRIASARLPAIGVLAGAYYRRLELALLAAADHVIAITRDFLPFLSQGSISATKASVVENWAPLDELPVLPRDNPWAVANLSPAGLRVVYAGTLGYKHDASTLLNLALQTEGHLHVFAEGESAQRLAATASEAGLGNLIVRPWVPYADLPALHGGADILLAMLGKDAGTFSVPSKVLSYFAAGRPVVAAIPRGNLARRLIEREGAGLAVDPGDAAGLGRAVKTLAESPRLRRQMGRAGRAYAERTFRIEPITDRVEHILRNVVARGAR